MIKCFGKRISFNEGKFNKEKCFPYSEHLLEQQKGSILRYMLRLFMISYIILLYIFPTLASTEVENRFNIEAFKLYIYFIFMSFQLVESVFTKLFIMN